MEFSKDQKIWVAEWIDRQFDSNRLFPCGCLASSEGRSCVCSAHLRAYKSWTNTPRKRRHIRSWIDEWLNAEETAELQAALAGRQARRSGKKKA